MNYLSPLGLLFTGHPLRSLRQFRFGRLLKNASIESPVSLHLGCGRQRFEGFVNIDAVYTPAVDFISDVVKVSCPERSVSRIESYHVIEHLSHRVVPELIARWFEMLMPGGVLVIECPDFDQQISQYQDGNEARLLNIFGLQRYPGDAHLYGYNVPRLTAMLRAVGFEECVSGPGTDYHAQDEPCLRIEAKKPA